MVIRPPLKEECLEQIYSLPRLHVVEGVPSLLSYLLDTQEHTWISHPFLLTIALFSFLPEVTLEILFTNFLGIKNF